MHVGMKQNLKHVLEIAETTTDPKTKLQARTIANDCYRFILEMSTNAEIVSDALKYVIQKQKQIYTLQKLDKRIEESEEKGKKG
jgi:hypothetical protein